ncbi:MAG: hypothetical protein J6S57_02660 [Alphaproteobacteria bacterium]|nr:hypothetical protein [Alphaproteobacteria bacterium]
MKKIFFIFVAIFIFIENSFGYQLLSTKEYGKGDAKNQNIVVKCTTDTGKISNETCSLRRYVRCDDKDKNTCNSWLPWRDLRNTKSSYYSWQAGASDCCKRKGLR